MKISIFNFKKGWLYLLGFIRLVRSCIARRWRLMTSSFYDFRRYALHSFAIKKPNTREQMKSELMMEYHRIEKGLALRDPRPGFGPLVIRNTMALLDRYTSYYGVDDVAVACISSLRAYEDFNRNAGQETHEISNLLARYEPFIRNSSFSKEIGGVLAVTKADILKACQSSFEEFVNARHSVRQFSGEIVDKLLIEKAVRIAQQTPSVCNRQSGRVHVFLNKEKKQDLLELQGGNRGFGDQIDCLLLVTSDLQCFSNAGERNQAWTDGGMFAMTLIYALHSLGLGTCCLNWSKTRERDIELRKVAEISDSEVVLMMIGIGNLQERFFVARSYRRKVGDVLTFH